MFVYLSEDQGTRIWALTGPGHGVWGFGYEDLGLGYEAWGLGYEDSWSSTDLGLGYEDLLGEPGDTVGETPPLGYEVFAMLWRRSGLGLGVFKHFETGVRGFGAMGRQGVLQGKGVGG